MEISYLGKTSVRFKNKALTLLIDPISAKERADVVIYSSGLERVEIAGPVSRDKTFIIDKDGEYELSGVMMIANTIESVGNKIMVSMITMDGVHVGYLGKLAEKLPENQVEKFGEADVLIVPLAVAPGVIAQTEPLMAVLVGYDDKVEVDKFLTDNKFEIVKRDLDKLKLDQDSLPESTEIVVLNV